MNLRIIVCTCFALLVFGATAHATMYATDIVYTQGSGLDSSSQRANTLNALGSYNTPAAPGSGSIDFLSLGMGGSAIISFGEQLFSKSVSIYETTWNRPNNYNEYAAVYGSMNNDSDSASWVKLGEIYNQAGDALGMLTLSFTGTYRYLKIEDITASIAGGTKGDGFDVNAVGVSPTPIPGAIWLLGSGFVGLLGIRRKMKA